VLIELVESQAMRLSGTLLMENSKNIWTNFDENGIVVDERFEEEPPTRIARTGTAGPSDIAD
jgi:hypothetical protein